MKTAAEETTGSLASALETAKPEGNLEKVVVEEVDSETEDNSITGEDSTGNETEVEAEEEEQSKKTIVLSFLAGLIVGSLVTGGTSYYLFKSGKIIGGSKVNQVVVTPTPTVKITPEVTPEATKAAAAEEIDYSKYKVQVLNGSGVKGEAAAVKDLLKGLDFASIDTGNATSSGFVETQIQVKEGLSDTVFEKVKKLLKDYKVVKDKSFLKEKEYDLIITVGAKKTD